MALTLKQALAMFWEQIQIRFVKRENGKGLSTNDFTTEEKNKLASLKNTTIDTTLTVSNAAADAKTVGDALAGKQPIGDYALKSEIPSTVGLATETYVNTKVASLVDSAPETLDTLNELAAALGDDPNFATTITTKLGELETAVDNFEIPNSNLVNGNTEDSLRMIGSCEESSDYVMGESALALGIITRAEGDGSVSEGMATIANGLESHAAGFRTYAGGDYSYAGGNYSSATAEAAYAVGTEACAHGRSSHAEGQGTVVEASFGHVEGIGTVVIGEAAHGEGESTFAEEESSHTEGRYTSARGIAAHAEGYGEYVWLDITGEANTLTYTYEVYEGSDTDIYPGASIRAYTVDVLRDEDSYTDLKYRTAHYKVARVVSVNTSAKTITLNKTLSSVALDEVSADVFIGTVAHGDASHAEGYSTIAGGFAQHVEGSLNAIDPAFDPDDTENHGKYLHITGNGTEVNNRSNAHALDWNGNAYYAGDVYVTGNGKNDFSGAKKLATENSVEAVRSSIPTKVSDLTNDAGYLTEHQSLAGYATEDYVIEFVQDEVGMAAAISAQNVTTSISTHNTATTAHNDIRDLISGLSTRLNALADSDDTTLDQMSEIVAYIKANKGLIDSVTTSKVNTADIVDNLTTNVATKPLSAAQGVNLKALVDGKAAKSDLTGLATQDYVNAQIQAAIANLLTREQMVEYVETSILGGEW